MKTSDKYGTTRTSGERSKCDMTDNAQDNAQDNEGDWKNDKTQLSRK